MADLNLPPQRVFTPEEAVAEFLLEADEKLATPAQVKAWLAVPQQRRRVPLPAVVRLGRRTGRSR